ncbi:MAG: histidinol-phosphate transaminase, partial [Actinomycetota bacterium]
YHSPQVDVRVRLNTNESPLAPPPEFVAALSREIAGISWNRYPDRTARGLRTALADHHGVHPENVFVANGSNEVIQTLLLTFAGPGRTVATFEPTYQLHSHIARITGARVVESERRSDFSLDPRQVVEVIEKSRPHVTFLCSPNNPTGTVDAPEVLDRALARSGGLIAVDEAYGQFAPRSALDLLDEETPLVVVRTFSKTWSMAAVRLGYLVGPKWLVAELDKVVLPYHLDAVKQIAGTVALRFAPQMLERVGFLVSERERLVTALNGLDLEVFPSGANFVLFRPRSLPGRHLWQALVDRGVLIRDCSSWPRLSDCLRVTIGSAEENDCFVQSLSDILKR